MGTYPTAPTYTVQTVGGTVRLDTCGALLLRPAEAHRLAADLILAAVEAEDGRNPEVAALLEAHAAPFLRMVAP